MKLRRHSDNENVKIGRESNRFLGVEDKRNVNYIADNAPANERIYMS